MLKASAKKLINIYLHKIKNYPYSFNEFSIRNTNCTDYFIDNNSINKPFIDYKIENVELSISLWPVGKDLVFNLNFDDLCPLFDEELNIDFGGSLKKGINPNFESLLNKYPQLKVTHFVIPNLNSKAVKKKLKSFHLDISKNVKWLDWLIEMQKSGQVEFGIHGYTHFSKKNIYRKHIELAYTNKEENFRIVEKAVEIFNKTGLNFKGFRAPGWDINSDLNIIDVLKDFGILYIGGSSLDAGFNYHNQNVSNYFPEYVKGLINIPQNLELDNESDILIESCESIIKKNGIISLKSHYTNLENIPNSFTSKNRRKLSLVLDYLENNYSGRIWFATFAEIAERFEAIRNLTIKKENDEQIFISNNSSYELPELSLSVTSNGLKKTFKIDRINKFSKTKLMNENEKYFFEKN